MDAVRRGVENGGILVFQCRDTAFEIGNAVGHSAVLVFDFTFKRLNRGVERSNWSRKRRESDAPQAPAARPFAGRTDGVAITRVLFARAASQERRRRTNAAAANFRQRPEIAISNVACRVENFQSIADVPRADAMVGPRVVLIVNRQIRLQTLDRVGAPVAPLAWPQAEVGVHGSSSCRNDVGFRGWRGTARLDGDRGPASPKFAGQGERWAEGGISSRNKSFPPIFMLTDRRPSGLTPLTFSGAAVSLKVFEPV